MRSVGMLISRAFCIARRSRKLPSGLPPPSLAAIVISRLARVKAWPRFASTMAFLCLMPAHLECPDTYSRPPNMLSLILLHHKTHPTTLSNLNDDNAPRHKWIIPGYHLTIKLDPSLVD